MDELLGVITGEGYECKIWQDATERVYFMADADIDADGANGQHGGAVAYRDDDKGMDLLANAGMRRINGKVVCLHDWARDMVILDTDNEPRVFPGGVIASMTWYRYPGMAADNPAAYVDSVTEPYIVVPPLIVQKTKGVVRGCLARVTWQGKSVDCVVADRGPRNLVGELSIAAAMMLGVPASPRNGGLAKPQILYELWPGIPAPGYELQPA
jgi:hypothetical protein